MLIKNNLQLWTIESVFYTQPILSREVFRSVSPEGPDVGPNATKYFEFFNHLEC